MISVVVPVFNTGRYLERALEALENQNFPSSNYELLVVDNGSDDDSPEILGRHPGVQRFSEAERGSYAARNRAIREAKGDILAFTDSDCYPHADWLRAIDDCFRDGRAQVLLGSRWPAVDRCGLRLVSEYENKKAELVCASNDPQVYYGYTNNMAVRRSAMDRFGPFVHRARGADTIFVRRVVDALSCGAVVYCPGMLVRHAEMDSLGAYYKKVMTYAHSPRAYRHIISTRPLSWQERVRVYSQATRGMRFTDSAVLLVLLLVGAVFWWLGGLAVSESDW